MSWIVNWDGRDWDVDPLDFSGIELSLIKQRTGLSFRELTFEALPDLDPEAIRVVFWIVARRDDPGLVFSDYPGPPMRVVLPALSGLIAVGEAMGKAMGATPTPTTETPGGDGSPSSSPSTETGTVTTA